jgi:hypothetical protein
VTAKQAGPATAGRYTAVHVRDGGQWLVATVRESSVPIASGFGWLEDLAWLIGSWKTKGEGAAPVSYYQDGSMYYGSQSAATRSSWSRPASTT